MFRAVDLPAMITLVPSTKLENTLHRQAKDHPELPRGVGQVLADLTGRHDGVPVTFREPRQPQGDWSLGLHLGSYIVWLFQTRRQDAYTIAAISPLRLRDHDRLARGCLLVRAGWHVATDYRQIPADGASHWQKLQYHWQKLTAQLGDVRRVPVLSAQHTQYLETIDRLIDATHQIADEQEKARPTYPYRAVTSTGERRHGVSPVYTFQVVGAQIPERGAFVQLVGQRGQRGQIVRVKDDQVTVRFDQPVTWERLTQQGQLEIATSNIVFEKQREAVSLLRTRQARNRTLLSVLVDHRVLPIETAGDVPGEELDEDQLISYRKALGVQDMMIVLGPPGTGKTRTISQIARSCALAYDRGPVLVASHTNRAVDNVLAKLPQDVTVVRIGNEGQVSPEGRPFLLERQAADLRTEITSRTGHSLQEYQHVDHAAEWTAELGRRLVELAGIAVRQRAAETGLHRLRRAAGGPAQSAVDAAAGVVDGHERNLHRREQRVERLNRRKGTAAGRATWPLIGGLFSARARSHDRRITALGLEIDHIRAAAVQARKQLLDAERALDDATHHVPEVRTAREALMSVVGQADSCRAAAGHAAGACRSILATVDTLPPADDLDSLHDWLVGRIPLLRVRAKILQDWHDEVAGATEQLYPELIRYADVIGTTCIGAASRPEISGVTFDLAIIDEAGQIGVANLLVPLVRAERAVLVGDHRQLPPFVDSELLRRPDAVDSAVRTLLTKSALEILVEVFPESHVEQLTAAADARRDRGLHLARIL
jgi:hypothetical protein